MSPKRFVALSLLAGLACAAYLLWQSTTPVNTSEAPGGVASVPMAGTATPEEDAGGGRPNSDREDSQLSPVRRDGGMRDATQRTTPGRITFRQAMARRIEGFENSGPLPERLQGVGKAALAELTAGQEAIASGCFAVGCFATLQVNPKQAEVVQQRLSAEGSAASRWPGARQRLEPIPLEKDRLQITWLLRAP